MARGELPQFEGIEAPERMLRLRSGSGVLLMRSRRRLNDKAEAVAFFDLKCAKCGLRDLLLVKLAAAENQRTLEKQRGASYVDDSGPVGP